MAKPKVLLLGEIDHAHKKWSELGEIAEIVTTDVPDRAAFIKSSKAGDLDGVFACYRTFGSVSQTGIWDDEIVAALPKSFKFVAHNGAGYDQIKPEALLARPEDKGGPIIATNVPTAVDDATATTALFLTIGALRNYATSISALRRGAWRGEKAPALGHDPYGKLVGVLGMGGIGRNFARKARGLGMRIAYHNRHRLDDDKAEGAEYLSFDELLSKSDVVMVSVPLSPATRHMISSKELAKMKKSAIIVNTARGAVIDEAALVEALDQGQISGAGLDVFEEEPKIHPGLLSNDKVLLLPHMGTYTLETQTGMEEWNIGNVRCAVEQRWDDMSVISEHRDAMQKFRDGQK